MKTGVLHDVPTEIVHVQSVEVHDNISPRQIQSDLQLINDALDKIDKIDKKLEKLPQAPQPG